MVVVMGLAAAAVALFVLQQSGAVSGVERRGAAAAVASAELDAAQGELETRLSLEPGFLTRTVWDRERARVCTADAATVRQPGQSWPARCGTMWTYEAPAGGVDGVVAQIALPRLGHPDLEVLLAVDSDGMAFGRQVTYRAGHAGSWALWSSADVDLDVATAGLDSIEVSGSVYTGGDLTVGSAEIATAQVVTEGLFNGDRTTANRYAAGGPDDEPRDRFRARPMTTADLTEGVRAAHDAACAETTPRQVGTRAVSTCIVRGGEVLTDTGETVTVPTDARRYLLIPGADAITLYVASGDQIGDVETCGAGCDLRAASATAVSAGTHPGVVGSWDLVGTLAWPANGTLATDADTVVGLCGSAFRTGTACATWSGTEPGSRFGHGLTVVAGTIYEPRDLWIGGSLHATAPVTLIATGQVGLPYWATTPNGDLTVDAAIVALGQGATTGLRAAPASRPAPVDEPGSLDTNWSGTLRVRGIVAPDLVVPRGFRAVEVTTAPVGAWAPGTLAGWQHHSVTTLAGTAARALLD